MTSVSSLPSEVIHEEANLRVVYHPFPPPPGGRPGRVKRKNAKKGDDAGSDADE